MATGHGGETSPRAVLHPGCTYMLTSKELSLLCSVLLLRSCPVLLRYLCCSLRLRSTAGPALSYLEHACTCQHSPVPVVVHAGLMMREAAAAIDANVPWHVGRAFVHPVAHGLAGRTSRSGIGRAPAASRSGRVPMGGRRAGPSRSITRAATMGREAGVVDAAIGMSGGAAGEGAGRDGAACRGVAAGRDGWWGWRLMFTDEETSGCGA